MKFGDFRLGIRLGVGFTIVLALTVLIGFVGIWNMKDLSTLTTKLYDHPYTVTTATLKIDTNIVKIHRAMKDVALAKDNAGIQKALSLVSGFETEVYKSFDIINERFLGDKSKVDSAKKLFADWKPIRDEVVSYMKSGNREEAAAITKGKGAKHVAALNEAIGGFADFASGMADKFVKNAGKARDKAVFQTYLLLLIVVVVGAILALLLTRSIVKPLRHAVNVADRISDGDLTMTVRAETKDEIGQLQNSMEKMVFSLSDMIRTNTATSQGLSESASEQAASLEETSSSLEEMSSRTKQAADNANQADGLMKEALDVVKNANSAMGQLTTSMDETTRASEETQKIIKTIDEIAFQTNLLALNAAVEAARAGEAGAGFAVVADEVRNLALRAADAAKNTAGLIEGTVKRVREGSALVNKTNEAFDQVEGTTQKVGELIKEIAVASAEQAEGVEQINKATSEMDTVTQKNAASAEELAASMAMFKVTSDGAGEFRDERPANMIAGARRREENVQPIAPREASPELMIPLDKDEDF